MSTPQEQANIGAVLAMLDAWRNGKVGFDDFLAEDCVYETAGFPVLAGRATVLEFLFGGGMTEVAARYRNPDLDRIRRLDAEVLRIVASGSVVFSERVDHHYDADGVDVLSPRLVGVMEFDDEARCVAWRDYHDPAYFTGHPSPRWRSGAPTALAPSDSDGSVDEPNSVGLR